MFDQALRASTFSEDESPNQMQKEEMGKFNLSFINFDGRRLSQSWLFGIAKAWAIRWQRQRWPKRRRRRRRRRRLKPTTSVCRREPRPERTKEDCCLRRRQCNWSCQKVLSWVRLGRGHIGEAWVDAGAVNCERTYKNWRGRNREWTQRRLITIVHF